MLLPGTFKPDSFDDLMRVIGLLVRTRGVVSISIHAAPLRVSYQHTQGSKVDLLEEPNTVLSWEEVIGSMELDRYSAKSLLSGVVHGWKRIQQKGRYPTHILVPSAAEFMQQLFPGEPWPHDSPYNTKVYGMAVMEIPRELTAGKILLCGGVVENGSPFQLDYGLILVVVG